MSTITLVYVYIIVYCTLLLMNFHEAIIFVLIGIVIFFSSKIQSLQNWRILLHNQSFARRCINFLNFRGLNFYKIVNKSISYFTMNEVPIILINNAINKYNNNNEKLNTSIICKVKQRFWWNWEVLRYDFEVYC